MKSALVKFLPKLLYFIIFLCLWHAVVVVLKLKVFILPSPIRVFQLFFDPAVAVKYHWPRHIGATVAEVGVGFLSSVVVGFGLGLIVAWSKVLSKFLMPIISMFNSLPKVALAPMCLLWLGYGLKTNIFIGVLVAFFPLVINSVTGLAAVDDDLLDLVKYLHASKLQIFIKIRIPNSLPYVFAGLKISATMCVMGAIVGEFIASEKGLGFLIREAQAFVDTPTMFACLLLLSVMGFLFFSLIQFAEGMLLSWNKKRSEA